MSNISNILDNFNEWNEQAIDQLISDNQNIQNIQDFKNKLLIKIVKKGQIAILDYVIEKHKFDLHYALTNGITVFQQLGRYAVGTGQTYFFDHLIVKYKQDIHITFTNGMTFLQFVAITALESSQIAAFNHLIEKYKLDIHFRNNMGLLLIDYAAKVEKATISLLKQGSIIGNEIKQLDNVNIKNYITYSEIADKIFNLELQDLEIQFDEQYIKFIINRLTSLFKKSGIPINFENYLNNFNLNPILKLKLEEIYIQAINNKKLISKNIEEDIISLVNLRYPILGKDNKLTQVPSYTTISTLNKNIFTDFDFFNQLYNPEIYNVEIDSLEKSPYSNFKPENILNYILDVNNRNEVLKLLAGDERIAERIMLECQKNNILKEFKIFKGLNKLCNDYKEITSLTKSAIQDFNSQTQRFYQIEQQVKIQNEQNIQNSKKIFELEQQVKSLIDKFSQNTSFVSKLTNSTEISAGLKRKRNEDDDQKDKDRKIPKSTNSQNLNF